MKIWLIGVGEPSLIDQGERLHRTGLMAKYYSENNHNVMLFNSTFFHQKEINRFKKTEIRKVNNNLSLIFLWGRDYKRHNLNRIFSNFDNAKSFKEIISDLEKPDLVLVSFPILELVTEVRKYCIENNIPFIIDIRDFWPDAFFELFPKFFSPLLKALFLWFNYSLRTSLKNAAGLISPFSSGLDWSRKRLHNKSQRSKSMNVIPFCPPNRDALSLEEISLKLHHPSKRRIKMVYIGNLTKLANVDWIIDLATAAENRNSILNFQIFGDGPRADIIQEASRNLSNFQYKGWINESELIVMMKKAHFGILAYNSDVLTHGVPNKFVDYLSFSLPIFSCTKGKVGDLIKEHDIGIYSNADEIHEAIKSIEALFLDEEKYIDISLNVQNLYHNHYSYEAVGIKLEKMLNI